MTFLTKLEKRMKKVNSLLCVGLDSEVSKLPGKFRHSSTGQLEFNKWMVEETHDYVCAYKPNIAFYEGQGEKGIKQLKQTIDFIHGNYSDIPIILDAKRGDISSTNQGYSRMAFDYLGADAMTIQPYLGYEAVRSMIEKYQAKGFFVLGKTSNPGSGEFQNLEVLNNSQVTTFKSQTNFKKQDSSYKQLWEVVAEKVSSEWNTKGNVMLVVGATYPEELARVRKIVGEMTLLVPGIGVQGGEVGETVKAGLNNAGQGIIVNSSRGIIFAKEPAVEAKKLRDGINNYRKAKKIKSQNSK
jgi:orotidine-5'-phosphate decarboxylase